MIDLLVVTDVFIKYTRQRGSTQRLQNFIVHLVEYLPDGGLIAMLSIIAGKPTKLSEEERQELA